MRSNDKISNLLFVIRDRTSDERSTGAKGDGALFMDPRAIASRDVQHVTKPRSAGQAVNPHVVPYSPVPKPDYDRMRDIAHKPVAGPTEQDDA